MKMIVAQLAELHQTKQKRISTKTITQSKLTGFVNTNGRPKKCVCFLKKKKEKKKEKKKRKKKRERKKGEKQADSYLNPGPRACLSNWPRGSPKWVCTIQQLFANIAHDQLQSSECRFIVLLSELNFSDDTGLSTAGTDRTPTSGLGRQMTLSTRL